MVFFMEWIRWNGSSEPVVQVYIENIIKQGKNRILTTSVDVKNVCLFNSSHALSYKNILELFVPVQCAPPPEVLGQAELHLLLPRLRLLTVFKGQLIASNDEQRNCRLYTKMFRYWTLELNTRKVQLKLLTFFLISPFQSFGPSVCRSVGC